MTLNKFFCKICGDYIEGHNLFGKFQSYDGVKINNNYYCNGECENKIRNKLEKEFLLNINYCLKFIISMIILCFIIIKHNSLLNYNIPLNCDYSIFHYIKVP